MKKDSLYLYWNDRKNNKCYKMGELYTKDNNYYFKYIDNINEVLNNGAVLLKAFPDTNKTYECKKLFACFATRLPDKRRPDMPEILEYYNLKEYDKYELLKASGAKLPTDPYEFRLS